MLSISFRGGYVTYETECQKQILFNILDYLKNKSRCSLHLLDKHEEAQYGPVLENTYLKLKDFDSGLQLGLISFRCIAELICTSQPIRMLEIGCGDGVWSRFLAEILAEFNQRSSFICLHDAMNMDWMEQISQADKLPNMSFLASDYETTHLQENHFDIVFINGNVYFEQPYEVLREAMRVLKQDGTLLVYMEDMPLLKSGFELLFETRETFEITPTQFVLVGKKSDCTWDWACKSKLLEQILMHMNDMEANILSAPQCPTEKLFQQSLRQLEADANQAVIECKIAVKIQLLLVKECLLDYMVGQGKAFADFYKTRCMEAVQKMKEICLSA